MTTTVKDLGEALALLALAGVLACSDARADEPAAREEASNLTEIVIQAHEPRYVAPTRRDRIGRIWVPVLLNGRGPFRLVLDTGATHTAATAQIADRLGLPLDTSPPVMLRGVTGSAVVPTIRVESLQVGDLWIAPSVLPIVADAFGGAEGLLGTEGLTDKRIYIDFRHDFINISRSKGISAPSGFTTLPFLRRSDRLLVVHARVSGVPALAIIDTGAQATVGNLALQASLTRRQRLQPGSKDEIIGATGEGQTGESLPIASIDVGSVRILRPRVTFGDMKIFEHWRLSSEPAVMIGMDALGLLNTLIIDYKRRELMVETPEHSEP